MFNDFDDSARYDDIIFGIPVATEEWQATQILESIAPRVHSELVRSPDGIHPF